MNLITLINGAKQFVSRIDFLDFANSAFRIRLTGTATADRTINLPNDSGTVLLDDRPIGSLNSGVSLRGFEPIVTVTASKTLALSDAGTIQVVESAATAVITIPLNATVPFQIGARVIIRKRTTQTVTFAATGGVSIVNELNASSVGTILSDVTLRKVGADTWMAEVPIPNNVDLTATSANTQTLGNSSTRLANTAFVRNELNNISKIRYLFVIAGESNAGGYATNAGLTAFDIAPKPNLKIWNNTSSVFQPLQIGTNNLLGHTGTPDNATHGLERSLTVEIENILGLPEAYLVKAGQGGSAIAQWSVGNASGYLTTLTNRFNAARTALTTAGYTVRPILIWMNGINDAVNGTVPATFRTATQAHFTQIRALMGANTPIIFPKIMPTNAAYIAINTEIATIDTANAFVFSPNTNLVPNNPLDPNHYTSFGYASITAMCIDMIRRDLGIIGELGAGTSRSTNKSIAMVVKRSTALSIPANTNTACVFNSIVYDDHSIYNTTTGTATIPFGDGGLYQASAMVTMDPAMQIRVMIFVNGVIAAQSPLTAGTTDSQYGNEVPPRNLLLNSSDVVSVQFFQQNTTNSSKNLLLNPEFQATFSLLRVA